jgi:UDP:flavonoid glycosyltransferase YjiC (YdhE family)
MRHRLVCSAWVAGHPGEAAYACQRQGSNRLRQAALYLTAEPFEYPRSDWPSNLRMVGPCDWDPPADGPPWLDEVDRPIVLVTTSSEFQDDGRLVRCALEALSGEDVCVVATLPAQDTTSFTPPPNARVFSFIPHGPILEQAACAVTHAGMGATQKALALAYQSVPCRSAGTSWRSLAESRWPRPAHASRRAVSDPTVS